jgi:hypothetical protein
MTDGSSSPANPARRWTSAGVSRALVLLLNKAKIFCCMPVAADNSAGDCRAIDTIEHNPNARLCNRL